MGWTISIIFLILIIISLPSAIDKHRSNKRRLKEILLETCVRHLIEHYEGNCFSASNIDISDYHKKGKNYIVNINLNRYGNILPLEFTIRYLYGYYVISVQDDLIKNYRIKPFNEC